MSTFDPRGRARCGSRLATGLAAAVLAVLVPAPAGAATRALETVPDGALQSPPALALAGEEAIVPRSTRRVMRFRALPLAGGAAVERARYSPPRGDLSSVAIDASPAALAALVGFGSTQPEVLGIQALAGPATGPLAALGPAVATAGEPIRERGVQVYGDRVIVVEPSELVTAAPLRLVISEPGAAPVTVELPAGSSLPVVAGELVAFALPAAGSDLGSPAERIVVRRWRTGEPVREDVISGAIAALDLRADGSAVVGEFRTGIVEVAPDGTQRRLSNRGARPVYAGDSIVFVRRFGTYDDGFERLAIAGPDRRSRPFGPPSLFIDSFAADEQRVLWAANDCVLTAELGTPAAAGPPAGPCPRSEVHLAPRFVAVRRGAIALETACIAAAPAGCRGTVVVDPAGRSSLRLGSARVRIPAGRVRTITVVLNARGLRVARRAARRVDPSFAVDARVTVVDPAGRRTVAVQNFAVAVDRP